MEENLTPTPTTTPIIIEFPDIDLSGITTNQETMINGIEDIKSELTTQSETLAIVLKNQQTQIESMKSLYLEVQLIALMVFMGFMWKWIKRLFVKRRKVDG